MKNKKKENSFGKELLELAKKHDVNLSSVKNMQEALKEGMRAFVEGALEEEMNSHMTYDKHQRSEVANYRNGHTSKKVKSHFGELDIKTPRDRENEFEPKLLPKNSRDISELEDKVISMYARGMSVRDITEMIAKIYGVSLSSSQISNITDKIKPLIEEWKNRPLQKTYAFAFIDGIRFKIREDGYGKEISIYIIIGIGLDGFKEFLGFWIDESESAKYWLSIFNEIKLRGVKSILVVSSDNLPGVSEAIKAVYPKACIQKCIVHQIRNSLKFVNYKHVKEFMKDMQAIYKAANINMAKKALDKFEEIWGKKYGYAIKSWKKNFDELTTFFDFPPEIRKMIYTTNIIEGVNRQIRKVTKTKGSFTSRQALDKLVYLVLTKIERKWTVQVRDWYQVLNQLTIMFDLDLDNM